MEYVRGRVIAGEIFRFLLPEKAAYFTLPDNETDGEKTYIELMKNYCEVIKDISANRFKNIMEDGSPKIWLDIETNVKTIFYETFFDGYSSAKAVTFLVACADMIECMNAKLPMLEQRVHLLVCRLMDKYLDVWIKRRRGKKRKYDQRG